MDYRDLVVVGAILGAASIPLLPACTAPDPGAITFQERLGGSSDTASTGTSSSTSSSTGGTTPTDGGGATDKIFKGEAFAFIDPGQKANGPPIPAGHTGAAAPPMEGQACLAAGCHVTGGAGGHWSGGGSVYAAIGGGKFAQAGKIQIRIIKPDGTDFATTCPDADGNFWFDTGADKIPPGSHVGIRTDTGATHAMSGALDGDTGGNCSAAGCHGTDTNRIFAN